MNINHRPSWIAFSQGSRIARGNPPDVIHAVKTFLDANPEGNALIFDAETSKPVEVDLRGSLATILQNLPEAEATAPAAEETTQAAPERAPGRPKLGVVAREVTLLPRHWEWLAAQSGGASVALRKLVDQARQDSKDKDRARQAQESAYRFMNALAGNEPNYEEALRALFAGDIPQLRTCMENWPGDLIEHILTLVEGTDTTQGAGAK